MFLLHLLSELFPTIQHRTSNNIIIEENKYFIENIIYFSSTLRRPTPSSKLFPYTTLVRSLQKHFSQAYHSSPRLNHFQRCPSHRPRLARSGLNRKSTRLNSSHTVTSYAVFCLKIKNRSYSSATSGRSTCST